MPRRILDQGWLIAILTLVASAFATLIAALWKAKPSRDEMQDFVIETLRNSMVDFRKTQADIDALRFAQFASRAEMATSIQTAVNAHHAWDLENDTLRISPVTEAVIEIKRDIKEIRSLILGRPIRPHPTEG